MLEAVDAFLLAFPALFSIVNPPSAAFIFREVTADRTHAERVHIAGRVGFYSLLVLVVSLWAGSYVIGFLGISIPALRIAGGLVVASSAWGLLNSPEQQEARKREQATTQPSDDEIAFYPLTLPFTAGPGAISVAIALGAGRPPHEALGWFFVGLTAAAVAMAAVIWVTFRFADRIVDRLSPSAGRIVTRLFAFLLLCIGAQILLTGVVDVLRPLLAHTGAGG
jgi:multiple antibiotic resistance protein